jgi:signal peptidase I
MMMKRCRLYSRSGVLALLSSLLWSYARSFSLQPIQRISGRLQSRCGNEQKWTRLLASSSPLSSTDDVSFVSQGGMNTNRTPPNYLVQHKTTVMFPKFSELMQLRQGEFVSSDTFTVPSTDENAYDFCVKLYPRGGGHQVMLPNFGGPPNEKVGVYLQFLPRPGQESVDASFGLRLKGQQKEGAKFDVEFRAGMRFVSLENSKLAQGLANDFGSNLMQTPLLEKFLGDSETLPEEQRPVQIETRVWIYSPPESKVDSSVGGAVDDTDESLFSKMSSFRPIRDVRTSKTSSAQEHDPEELRVGKVVVPTLRRLAERPRMFEQGAYPGVDYRILRIIDPVTNQDLFYSQPGAEYDIKPIYKLVSTLERPWPARVNERDIPKLYTQNMYNGISVIGSLFTAITGLATAFVISQAVSFFYIPSRSMDPTLQIGDWLLVDKVTPRLPIIGKRHEGDVVLFHPPEKLREIVARSGGRISERDLFVKRIAGVPGDILSVDKSGAVRINDQTPKVRRDLCTAEPLKLIEQYIEPSEGTVVGPGQVAVLGDCSSVSIDSRVWGPLPETAIVGRPIVRLWPPSRFGAISALPTVDESQWKD